MATVTPIYNWPVPTSTDYVKDGASAIESLGDAIDASLNTISNGANVGVQLVSSTTFTTSSSYILSNVFTSKYSNYRIVCNYTNSANSPDLLIRLTASGTPLGNGNYASSVLRLRSDAGATVSQVTTNGFYLGGGSNTQIAGGFVMDLMNPQAAERTFATAQHSAREEVALNYGYLSFGQTQNTTSYDGINFIPSSGTVTGTMRIYGLRNS